MAKRARQASESQPLLSTQMVDLTPQQQIVYSEGAQWFSDSGWDIEPFGGGSVLIRAVPQVLVSGRQRVPAPQKRRSSAY